MTTLHEPLTTSHEPLITMQNVPIALLGCGTVGSGVARLLTEDADYIAQRTGLNVKVRYVLAKQANPRAREALASAKWVDSLAPILADPDVQIVCELIGGDGFALTCAREILKSGRSLVTANKAMLAKHGKELFTLAHQAGGCIGFEASCAGGVPLFVSLRDGLVANRINAIYGILNGTANYILTEMSDQDKPYAQALAEAQAAGYAEADPSFDVQGIDAGHKIAIIAAIAFGADIDLDSVPIEGIAGLALDDILYARELGYTIKLIAAAQRVGEGIMLRVHPALVPRSNQLAHVKGPFNAISIFGHATGHVLLLGRGAGQSPTASAVVSDIVDIALGHAHRRFQTLRIWPGKTQAAQIVDTDQLFSRCYVRLTVVDRPGVMAQVTKIFGDCGISLSGLLQKEVAAGGTVPIVITTHLAREGDLRQAIEQIARLNVVKAPPVWFRVLEMPDEALDTSDTWHRKD
ncbi:MAG: Homoserine dehydrogenase [Phycisphaerae bacterium]|nr:Homoserine dehydrogenase [Phycisphaerae bacterium]